jgi:glycosyltransferase involved in cell wall biosynthesis
VIGNSAEIVERLAAVRPGSSALVVERARGVRDLRGLLRYRRALKASSIEILQANLNWMPSCREALLAARTLPSLRVITVEHLPLNGVGLRSRLVKRLTAQGLSAHVAVGDAAARLVEQASKVERGSVLTIHNGVVDHGIVAHDADESGPAVFGCLARLDPVKGIDVLLDALASVPDVQVEIAGEGAARAGLVAQAHALGLDDRFMIHEWTDDPGHLLATWDAFVLASRAEGFPLSILEAMLAGLPVIATDVGSVREAVLDGVTGFVVPPDDSVALARAMALLGKDQALRHTMGAAGRERILEHFSLQGMAHAYEDLYERITRQGHAS